MVSPYIKLISYNRTIVLTKAIKMSKAQGSFKIEVNNAGKLEVNGKYLLPSCLNVLEAIEKPGGASFTDLLKTHKNRGSLARFLKKLEDLKCVEKTARKGPYVLTSGGKSVLEARRRAKTKLENTNKAHEIFISELPGLSGFVVSIPKEISNFLTEWPKYRKKILPGLLALAFQYVATLSSPIPWVAPPTCASLIDDKPFFLSCLPRSKYPRTYQFVDNEFKAKTENISKPVEMAYCKTSYYLFERAFQYIEEELSKVPKGVEELQKYGDLNPVWDYDESKKHRDLSILSTFNNVKDRPKFKELYSAMINTKEGQRLTEYTMANSKY